jgi:acetoin utilization deacetylase AcuC-like enzyme
MNSFLFPDSLKLIFFVLGAINNMKKIHIWIDLDQDKHWGGATHPEHPRRIDAIRSRMSFWNKESYVLHEMTERISEKGAHWLGVDRPVPWRMLEDGDTYVTPYTSTLLRRGSDMIQDAVGVLADGLTDCAFVCIRPPGHHSGSKGPSGFCHQNNAWLAAKEFYKRRIRHCTIFDFDAHHGDGTEDCVRRGGLRGIKFCSTHAFGIRIYPGTGDRTGNSDTILNIPLSKGFKGSDYEAIMETEVIPFLSDSEVIIVSAGYDGHEEDPMGLLQFQDSTYEKIGSVLRSLGKPILYLLEGGYEPTVLARCVERTLSL